MNEIKLKSWKPVIIFICIVAPIVLFCFLMILSGRVTVILKGYAVDSSDNLYIGKEHSIEVYKEQKLINNIPIQYTDYAFTIKNGQEIVLSANNKERHTNIWRNMPNQSFRVGKRRCIYKIEYVRLLQNHSQPW